MLPLLLFLLSFNPLPSPKQGETVRVCIFSMSP